MVVPSPVLLLLDLHIDFSGDREGTLVFPSLEECSTVYCDPHSQRLWCWGPALVDPGNSKVGMASASLEKYIFNYRYIERLETDSVVGRLVEKKRLNNLDYVE